jgi:hypothetical protein
MNIFRQNIITLHPKGLKKIISFEEKEFAISALYITPL